MNIINQLREQLKQAMRDNDSEKRDYIRSILTRITEYCVEQGLERNKPLPDEDVIKVITSLKKSLEKALKMFEKGGADIDNEIAQHYREEIAFYEKFLPDESENRAEIRTLIEATIAELGITNIKQAGKIIGHIMKTHKELDGTSVRNIVMELLQR